MIIPGNQALRPASGESRWHVKRPNEATPPVLFVTARELRFRGMDIHWGKKSWYWKAFFPMSMALSAQVCIDTHRARWLPGQGNLKVMPLHEFAGEHVALVKWPAGEHFQPHRHLGGEEIFVLSGELKDENGNYPRGSWLRNPHRSEHCPYVEQETLIWVKTGHLSVVDLAADDCDPG